MAESGADGLALGGGVTENEDDTLVPAAPSRGSLPPRQRPQPSRFLSETARKIAEDSARRGHSSLSRESLDCPSPRSSRCGIGSEDFDTMAPLPELPRPGTAPSAGSGQRYASKSRDYSPMDKRTPSPWGNSTAYSERGMDKLGSSPVGSELEMWRQTFHQEAMECVRAMSAVFDSASVSHFASRFDDWRKMDMKATAEMQQHVKQLAKVNKSVEEYLLKWAALEEFVQFQGTFASMTQSVHDLNTARRDIKASVEAVAASAAEVVLSEWRSEARAASELLKEHVTLQTEGQRRHETRQDKVEGRLAQLEATVSRMCGHVDNHSGKVEQLKAAQEASLQDTEETLREAIKGMMEATTKTMKSIAVKDAAHWKDQAMTLENILARTRDEVERVRTDVNKADAQVKSLDAEVKKTKVKLETTEAALEEARSGSMFNGMKRLKEVEARGNIKVNRQTGELRLSKILAFQAPPAAALKADGTSDVAAIQLAEPSVSMPLLEDLAEALALFVAPVQLELQGGKIVKSATPQVWERILNDRALFLSQLLEGRGVPEGLIQCKVVANAATTGGEKGGASGDTLVVQLDKCMFVEAEKKTSKKK